MRVIAVYDDVNGIECEMCGKWWTGIEVGNFSDEEPEESVVQYFLAQETDEKKLKYLYRIDDVLYSMYGVQ